MIWSYRVIREASEQQHEPFVFSLYEVYYEENGTPSSWTKHPIQFEAESFESLLTELRNALRHAEQMPTLEVLHGKLVQV